MAALALLPLLLPAVLARSRFEPTDLELEDAGVVELDLQVGTMRGDPRRFFVLDWELDLGLSSRVELGVDGAVSWVGDAGQPSTRVWDPLWVSTKIGVFDARDDEKHTAWAFGVQLGPRLAVQGARGIGAEGLLLLGRTVRSVTVVANAGLLVDARTVDLPRAVAAQVGLDATWALSEAWALLGEIAGQRFFTDDPHQLAATVGLARTTEWCDFSLVGFAGFLTPGDRFGVLLGVSPKLRVF